MKNRKRTVFLFSLFLVLAACFMLKQTDKKEEEDSSKEVKIARQNTEVSEDEKITIDYNDVFLSDTSEEVIDTKDDNTYESFSISKVPAYSGLTYCTINDNVPFFTEEELRQEAFEDYSSLDKLGRTGRAYAMLDRSMMPTEERGEIGNIKPSGWHTVKYDNLIADRYLYNRCHLIAYQLTGKNAVPENLITGTRFFNTEGMQSFESQVADYINSTGNRVLYRVTPVYKENDLVATGVLMEALSIDNDLYLLLDNLDKYSEEYENMRKKTEPGETGEEAGDGSRAAEEVTSEAETPSNEAVDEYIDNYDKQAKYLEIIKKQAICFSVFVYNVQPGIVIDYATGDSHLEESDIISKVDPSCDYIINKKTMKFHLPSCDSVKDISDKNKWYFTGERQKLIDEGYTPCKNCNP